MSQSHPAQSAPIRMAVEPKQSRASPRRQEWSIAIGGVLALIAVVGGWAILDDQGNGRIDPDATAVAQAQFEEATGVQVVRVSVTAGGGMLDLRYRVLNPDKAVAVHDDDSPPAIIHEVTNRRVNRPFMHHSKAKDLHLAVTYYELLLNQDEIVKPGDLVTVVIGGAKLEHVVVQ